MEVKRQQLEGQARIEELYIGAIEAMKSYSGNSSEVAEDDEPQ